MKSVCIVGAGPGGLVAAKTLLEQRTFRVTVFEKSESIGGLWNFNNHASGNDYLSATTPTNLSRYTVAFSDLAWESVPLQDKLPMFPQARQVCDYLNEYTRRYIPNDVIQFNRSVVSTKLVGIGQDQQWEVTIDTPTGEQSSNFDYLVNATGFFSAPKTLGLGLPEGTNTVAIHSSSFKGLGNIFPDDSTDVRNTSILVLGGGNSGGEAAASIAFQLSSAQYSPNYDEHKRYENITVRHLIKRHLYVIPPIIPSSKASCFAPLDLQFYDLKWRPTDSEISSSSGRLPGQSIKARHQAIQGMVGDQKDLNVSSLTTDTEYEAETAAYAALSEHYPEFVRANSIYPYMTKLSTIYAENTSPWLTIQSEGHDGSTTTISNISAIVHANGYDPIPALSFLPEAVKASLEFDPNSTRLPVLLQNWQTLNPAVPNLGFIGFYEGPYWGVMEMQARLLAVLWSSESLERASPQVPQLEHEALPALRDLRKTMQERQLNVPQYWFSDYTAYLEELSRYLKLERNDASFAHPRDGIVCPARYLSPNTTDSGRQEAQRTMHSLYQTLEGCAAGRYRARAVFRGLQGHWTLDRILKSERKEMPSGKLTGEAWFHPRMPTDSEFDAEMLYIESGEFQTNTGMKMTATRRYVYRYCENRDELSVWFVKTDDTLMVDYLFHKLEFEPITDQSHDSKRAVPRPAPIKAGADHLCVNDMYRTECSFTMQTIRLKEFEVKHSVHGPAKDYVATATYTRHN